jgi:Protein of unknown function (DUF4242)
MGRMPQLSAQARRVCEQLVREGTQVRFVRSIYVPEDGTCFHLYQANSWQAVLEAARRAASPEVETSTVVRPHRSGDSEPG